MCSKNDTLGLKYADAGDHCLLRNLTRAMPLIKYGQQTLVMMVKTTLLNNKYEK